MDPDKGPELRSDNDVEPAGTPNATLISCERDRIAASRVGKPIGLMFQLMERPER